LERQGKPLTDLLRSTSSSSPQIEPIFQAARKTAASAEAAPGDRAAAIALLGRDPRSDSGDFKILRELLSPQSPLSLQEAALDSLKRSRDTSVAETILASWRGFGPAIRLQAMSILASRPEWLVQLLAAIETGRLSAGEIGAPMQQKLRTSADLGIRSRAEKLLSAGHSDRQGLVKEYAAAANAKGDSTKGMALFRQNCAACHRLRGEGNEIGPDLGTVSDKPTEVLLAAILDPNQAVESRYISYNVSTKSDRELTGIIAGETTTSITLRSQGGTEEVLLRNDLKELSSSGISLMPEGFEKILKPEDMADLFACIRGK
jgi:putative heme-binding domain-containing protein